MNKYLRAFLNSAVSILPISIIIFVLSITGLAPIGYSAKTPDGGYLIYIMLLIGAVFMMIGLSLFSIGAQNSLIKVGEYMGGSLSKQKRLWVVILFAFLLGALITCAEPSILIISEQVQINKWILIGAIAAGVGIFVVIGILRIIYHKSLKIWYLFYYLIVFMLICILMVDKNNHVYLPFIFDAGGVTTGSATVPFILALGAGVAMTRGGDRSSDSSFGIVGLASVGPIITMVILILVDPAGFSAYKVPAAVEINRVTDIFVRFKDALLPVSFNNVGTIIEVVMALAPIMVIFFIYEAIYIKLSKKKVMNLMFGFLIVFVGLTVFLTAVGSSMSPIGLALGKSLAIQENWIIILLAFAIGLVTILCEPAVHVLTTQIEDVSNGQLKKSTVLITLSIGVGVAVCLSVIRTIFNFSIIYIIVPGYLLSFILMMLVPNLYTAIAFDSGGTASGPMAVSFVLPLIIGLCSVRMGITEGIEFYETAFGVVALIALTPIIAIQSLGLTEQIQTMHALKIVREQLHDERNNEIIHF